jgi:hypothetical protein
MNITALISQLKTTNVSGFQISKQNGHISSTWLLYKSGDFYYFFDINQKIEFTERYRYSEGELTAEMQGGVFRIDLDVN